MKAAENRIEWSVVAVIERPKLNSPSIKTANWTQGRETAAARKRHESLYDHWLHMSALMTRIFEVRSTTHGGSLYASVFMKLDI